jgi:hypothetical protein
MAKLKSQQKRNFIKTCFSQVTVEDLLAIEKHTPRQVIQALSSLTAEEVSRLSSEEVLTLYELVSFIDDLNEVGAVLPLNFNPPPVDVAGGTFEQAERAKLKAAENKAPYRLFLDLVGIYYGPEYLTGAAAPAVALGALIYEDLTKLLDRFKDLAGEKPTDEEEEAGIEALHTFGPYGICESIASKYSVRPYEVFAWTAEEVYLELTYQLAKSRYQANLRSIEKRKNQSGKK